MLGASPGTLNKELARLRAAGLLESTRVGNQLHYSANLAHPVFPELAGLLRKTVGLADVLAAALAPIADDIDVAFVFGSVARGAETAHSDVDVLVIGPIDFGRVIDATYLVGQQIGRDVNPKVFSPREWKSKIRARDAFASGVMASPKLFLIGDEDGLAGAGGHQP